MRTSSHDDAMKKLEKMRLMKRVAHKFGKMADQRTILKNSKEQAQLRMQDKQN